VKPDAIEVEAGIDRFNQFAEFNVIYSLADGDISKYEAVFNLSYDEAFITLARKAEEARYSKRLRKVMKQHDNY
jgi:hypothetical protein